MQIDIKIICGNNIISNVSHSEFLALVIDNALSCCTHTEGTVNKLNSLCYMSICVKPYMSHSSLIKVYTHFHSIMSYGIIFWVNYLIVGKILNSKTEQLELHQEIERRTRVEIY